MQGGEGQESVRFRKLAMHELGRVGLEDYRVQPKWPVVLALENIRSLHNVGAIFRTADAFGIESLALCGFTGCPPHREIHASALGAEFSVAWQHFESGPDALAHYSALGYHCVAVEQCEGSMHPVALGKLGMEGKPVLLFLGNEVEGVSQGVVSECDACVEIPQVGTKHSLNVSVAAGIILWGLLGERLVLK